MGRGGATGGPSKLAAGSSAPNFHFSGRIPWPERSNYGAAASFGGGARRPCTPRLLPNLQKVLQPPNRPVSTRWEGVPASSRNLGDGSDVTGHRTAALGVRVWKGNSLHLRHLQTAQAILSLHRGHADRNARGRRRKSGSIQPSSKPPAWAGLSPGHLDGPTAEPRHRRAEGVGLCSVPEHGGVHFLEY